VCIDNEDYAIQFEEYTVSRDEHGSYVIFWNLCARGGVIITIVVIVVGFIVCTCSLCCLLCAPRACVRVCLVDDEDYMKTEAKPEDDYADVYQKSGLSVTLLQQQQLHTQLYCALRFLLRCVF